MKRLLFLLCIATVHFANSQTVAGKVVDSATNKPLAYATVSYGFGHNITYTDANGFFYLQQDSLTAHDSIIIQFLGYKKYSFAAQSLKNGDVFELSVEMKMLNPVTVYACRKTRNYEINKKTGRIKHYIGPGPETKFVVLAKYNNTSGRDAYINKVKIFIDQTSPEFKVPIRFRWYEWDVNGRKPGHELTDTNILVYPYQDGWNEFTLPSYTIFAAKDYIVFGLEFIYPSEYQQEFAKLKTGDEKIKWLTNIQHRWSLGMQYSDEETDAGFYSINNGPFSSYSQRNERYYMRPAIILTVTACADR